jgi:biofilm formation protein (YliH/bssR)
VTGGDSPEDLLAFGRRCRDTRNWWAGMTLLCADAHSRYSNLLGDKKKAYLASPEVWSEITSVYDEYLKLNREIEKRLLQIAIRLDKTKKSELAQAAKANDTAGFCKGGTAEPTCRDGRR